MREVTIERTTGEAPTTLREQVGEFFSANGIHTVELAFADIQGVARGKRIPARHFLGTLDRGIPFCKAVLGWDVYGTGFTGGFQKAWNTAINWTSKRILDLQGLFDSSLDTRFTLKVPSHLAVEGFRAECHCRPIHHCRDLYKEYERERVGITRHIAREGRSCHVDLRKDVTID